jgi:hypothetical protein
MVAKPCQSNISQMLRFPYAGRSGELAQENNRPVVSVGDAQQSIGQGCGMKWFQSKYDQSKNLERYLLRPSDWKQDPNFDCYESEWYASVTRCDNGQYVASIEPADEARYEESYEEYFSTLPEAQRWAELEMSLDRRMSVN